MAPQRGRVAPPAAVAQRVLEVPPDALDEVQLRGGGGQPQRANPVVVGHPPAARGVALVVADVVQHHQDLAGGQRRGQAVEERDEGRAILPRGRLPEEGPGREVQRPVDGGAGVLPGRRHAQCRPPPAPHAGQAGVAVDFALVQIDRPKAAGAAAPGKGTFPSHASASRAAATTVAS